MWCVVFRSPIIFQMLDISFKFYNFYFSFKKLLFATTKTININIVLCRYV